MVGRGYLFRIRYMKLPASIATILQKKPSSAHKGRATDFPVMRVWGIALGCSVLLTVVLVAYVMYRMYFLGAKQVDVPPPSGAVLDEEAFAYTLESYRNRRDAFATGAGEDAPVPSPGGEEVGESTDPGKEETNIASTTREKMGEVGSPPEQVEEVEDTDTLKVE